MKDFVPVVPINYSDLLLVVHPSLPAKSVKDLMTVAEFEKYLHSDIAKWAKVVKIAGARPDQ
jgi:tripartite-type tricarboxylate transporter receptor subunit TctC